MRHRTKESSFRDKPFSAVFHQPTGAKPDRWRIRNSGVQSHPESSAETRAVLAACTSLGVRVAHRNLASPANANSYKVSATFLDGGLQGETGNYWYAPRGVWVTGRKAVLLLALQLGLAVRTGWYAKHGTSAQTLESLKKELTANV